MAITLGEAIVYFKGDQSELNQGIDSAEKKTTGFVGNATKLIGGALVGAAAAGGAALIGLGVAGGKAFIDFEQQMNEVFTLMPGLTKGAMDDMTGEVKNFAKEFGVLPEDVVPALYQAISAGVPSDNVFSFLEVANKAAVGGVTDLETAVDGITSVVNAYGEETIDAAKASDLMFTAVKLGKTDFGQLSGALFNVIPTAAAVGVEFGDVTAALAAMTAQGTPTSVATTQLRQLLVELSKDGGKASEAFEELSGKSFVDFVAQGGNVQDALAVMEQAAEANNVRLSDMFGSVEAGNAALALTGQGAQTFADNLAEMDAAAGATDTAFQQMDSGIGKSFEKIRAAWAVAILDIGTKLAPAIAWIADVALEQMPKFVAVVTGAFDVVGKIIDDTVKFVQRIFSGEFADSFTGAAGRFDFLWAKVREIMPLVKELIETVLVAISAFWDSHGATIMHIVGNVFETVVTVVSGAMSIILDVIKLALQLLTGDWEGAWNTFKNILSTIWDTITSVLSLKLDTFKQIFLAIFPDLRNAWENFGTWWTNGVNGTMEELKQTQSGFATWWENSTQSMLSNVKGWWQGQSNETHEIARSGWSKLEELWQTGLMAISGIQRAGAKMLEGDFAGGLQSLKYVVIEIWQDIQWIFGDQIDGIRRIISNLDLYQSGRALIDNFWRGIRDKFAEWETWYRSKLQNLRNLLPFSEPKDPSSPLRGLRQAGRGLVEQVQKGIDESTFGLGGISLGNMMQPAASGPSIGAINIVLQGSATYEDGREVGRGLLDELRSRGLT